MSLVQLKALLEHWKRRLERRRPNVLPFRPEAAVLRDRERAVLPRPEGHTR